MIRPLRRPSRFRPRLRFWFSPAPDESRSDAEFRASVSEVLHSLQSAQLDYPPRYVASVAVPPDLTIQATEKALLLLAGAGLTFLGNWLKAKYGRKIRVKYGKVEVEATSVDEVRSLLETIKTRKPRRK